MVSHLVIVWGKKSISDLVSFLQFDYFQPKMVMALHCTRLLSAKNGDGTALHLQITQYTALTVEKFDHRKHHPALGKITTY